MRAGLGPSITLAHFSEVTQGKVGGRGERRPVERERQKLISYVFSLFCFPNGWGPPPPPFPISHPKSTTTPTVHLLLSSPRHPCILEEKPQTSFLLCQFVFQNTSTRPFTISACFALLKPSEQCVPTSVVLFKMSSSLVSLIYSFCVLPCHRLPLVCCWPTVRCCQASTSGAASAPSPRSAPPGCRATAPSFR